MKLRKLKEVKLIFLMVIIASITLPIKSSQTQELEILNHGFYNYLGYSCVVGEIQNIGNNNLEFVNIVATFYDKDNRVLDSPFTYTEIDLLEPGQKSPFKIVSLEENLQVDHYKLYAEGSRTFANPYKELRIQGVSTSVQYGYYTIHGEVENIGNMDVTFVRVVSTLYDSDGNVVDTDFTYTDPEDLRIGQSAPFELVNLRELTPASYSLQVQCSEVVYVQEETEGSISIYVKDEKDKPVSNVRIKTLNTPSGQLSLSGLTTTDGSIIFDNIKAGDYEFEISKNNYHTERRSTSLNTGKTSEISIVLKEVGSTTSSEKSSEAEGIPSFPDISILIGIILAVVMIYKLQFKET